MRNNLAATLVILAALGCGVPYVKPERAADRSTRSPEQQIQDALGKGTDPSMIKVCEYDVEMTGSHMRAMKCRYLDDAELQRASAHQFMMRSQQVGQNRGGS